MIEFANNSRKMGVQTQKWRHTLKRSPLLPTPLFNIRGTGSHCFSHQTAHHLLPVHRSLRCTKWHPKFLLPTSPTYTKTPSIEIYRVVLQLLVITPWWYLVATWVTPPHRNAGRGEGSQPPLPSTLWNLPSLTYLVVYFNMWTVALAAPEWHSPLNSNVWHPTPTDVICGIIKNVAPDLKWSPSTTEVVGERFGE